MNREDVYTKLIRVGVNNKIFDIFADQNHRKEFLEVKKKGEQENYYYPILADYLTLNNIYNPPFDGILYDRKYAFRKKVYLVILGAGILISVYNDVLKNNPYKLQKGILENNYIVKMITQEKPQEVGEQELYTVVVTESQKLDKYNIEPVTINDLRNSLAENQKIPPKYRVYFEEFIDCLEEKCPNADYRVFNSNLKRYQVNNHLVSDEEDGSFEVFTGIINLKEKYLDKEGNESLDIEKVVVFHELMHGLNNGLIKLSEDVIILYKFSPTQFGTSFKETYTSVFADYLMSKNYKDYFSKPERQYISYSKTSNLGYQTLRMFGDSYTFEDFINRDISYVEKKLKEIGLKDAIDIIDTYHLSVYEDEDISIIEQCEFEDMVNSIYKQALQKDIESETDFIKQLRIINECSEKIYVGTKKQIIENVLDAARGNEIIQIIDRKETLRSANRVTDTQDELEEQEGMVEYPTIKITSPTQSKIYPGLLTQIQIYRTYENGIKQYHFGYENLTEVESFETGEKVKVDPIDIISLSEILPQASYEIKTEIFENETFKEQLEECFKVHEDKIKEEKASQEKQEREDIERKQRIKDEILPLIENAIVEGKTDLEINQLILENVKDQKDIPIASGMFRAAKEDHLIYIFDVIKDEEDRSVFIEDQGYICDCLSGDSLIYTTREEEGVKFHLGERFFTNPNGKEILIDIDGIETATSDCIKIIPLSEFIPEIEKYKISIKKEFLDSEEFRDLIHEKFFKIKGK